MGGRHPATKPQGRVWNEPQLPCIVTFHGPLSKAGSVSVRGKTSPSCGDCPSDTLCRAGHG